MKIKDTCVVERLGNRTAELEAAFRKLTNPQDIVDAFEVLQARAAEIGTPVKLHPDTPEDLVLYYHEDYSDCVLVDKGSSAQSNEELTQLFSK